MSQLDIILMDKGALTDTLEAVFTRVHDVSAATPERAPGFGH